jgi:hypothetical protein
LTDVDEGSGLVADAPNSSTEPPYLITESHDRDVHHLRVLEPIGETYLEVVANEYRRLRTASDHSVQALTLDGVEVLDVEGVQQALVDAAVPRYRPGNFAVVRSDLAEVLLGLVGELSYGTRYGYRSVRDRELVQQPGRGIDQIGVELERVPVPGGDPPERLRVTLVLGEAKVSSHDACPPGVVDTGDDCLREQHLGHLRDREATAKKVWNASKRSSDQETQQLLRIAAALLKRNVDDGGLRVVVASLMVRPVGYATPEDFGTFYASVDDYAPAEIRFHIFRLPVSVDTAVQEFERLARGEQEEGEP